MLLAGLPEDALLARPVGQLQTWTQMHELLASGLEVASVTAADRKLKQVVEVPRPKPPRKRRRDRDRKGPMVEHGEVSVVDAMAAYAANGRVRKPQRAAAT